MAWKNVQYENGKYRTSEGGGGGSSTFADLDDVSFSNIQNGQVPKYNSTTQKWENANESGGGGTVTDVTVDDTSVVNQQGVAEIPAIPDGLHHYSTTEQVIGTWIDGKPVYEKCLYGDAGYTSGLDYSISLGMQNESNVRIIDGWFDIGTDYLPLNFTFGSSSAMSGYAYYNYGSEHSLKFRLTGWYYNKVFARLQYTKTTDV